MLFVQTRTRCPKSKIVLLKKLYSEDELHIVKDLVSFAKGENNNTDNSIKSMSKYPQDKNSTLLKVGDKPCEENREFF